MGKIFPQIFALTLIIGLFSPGNGSKAYAAPAAEKNGGILVAYFSLPETDNPNNMTRDEENSVVVIDGKVLGNTQYMARVIQEGTGADIFRIEPETPYPRSHRALLELGKAEKDKNSRPKLKAKVENPEEYGTIFLGYPNWYADMPMILYSFLEQHDFSGKTIIPFNTHGGSGFSRTIDTIAGLQPNAAVRRTGLSISRDDIKDAAPDILAWLRTLGFQVQDEH